MSVNRDVIEDLSRGKGTSIQDLATIIAGISRRTVPTVQDDAETDTTLFSPHDDIHDTSGPKPAGNFSESDYIDNLHVRGYHRWPPQIPTPCPLIETLTDTGIQFSTGIGNDFSKRFGGGAKPNGSYITITDHAILNPSDKISIAMYVYIPATSSGDERQYYIDKGQYRIFIEKHDIAANTIKAIVSVGGTEHTISYQFTPNQWYHVVITIKSPNLKMYFNKTLVASSTALVGNIDTTNNPLRLFNRAYGVRLLESGGKRLLESGGLRRLE